MKVLLGAHTFSWLVQGDARLSREAETAFLEPDNEPFFSAASSWEVCVKQGLGKLGLTFGGQATIMPNSLPTVLPGSVSAGHIASRACRIITAIPSTDR